MEKVIPYILILLCFACKKKDEEGTNTPPTIELISTTPLEVVEFDNPVIITIKYNDLEGDIGEVDPDNYSLEIKDSRLSKPDYFHIPPQTPNNEALTITEGQFQVNPTALFILGNAKEETTTYSIKIRDRAGNWSNTLVTPEILIKDSL